MEIMRWPRLIIASLLLSLILTGGCSQPLRQPGVLRLSQKSDVSTLDPARAYDTTSIQFVRLLYRGLVDYDMKSNIYNEVAASRAISRDGKTYTFKLRRDVRFHSGRRVVSEDYRYAIERVLDPKTASDGLSLYTMIDGAEEWTKDRKGPKKLKHIRGIRVPNQDTIVFRLKKPDATFLNYLALPFAYAVPREHVEKLEKERLTLSDHPNGCGPYKLTDWVHDSWMQLDKNLDYFHKSQPKNQRIEIRFGIDTTLQLMLFEQGSLDVVTVTDAFPPDFLRIKNSRRWGKYMVHAPMMDIRYMSLNTELAPFNDRRVRQAMNYAINRKLITGFLTGRAIPAHGALPPGMPAYNPKLKGYDYNQAKAKALLKAAGFKNDPKKPLTLWYSDSEPWYGRAAQSIKTNLRDAGMDVSIEQLRYSELKAKAGTRKAIHMALLGWIQDFPDPSNFLDPLFNTRSIRPTAALNRAFYSNPKVDKILDAAIQETNRPKRLKMYQEAEKIIVADAPFVFLHHTERYGVRQPWIEGYQLHPMWSAVWEDVIVNP